MRLSRQKIICILVAVVLSLSIFTCYLITSHENKKSRLISEKTIREYVSNRLGNRREDRIQIEPNDLTDEDFANINSVNLGSAPNLKTAKGLFKLDRYFVISHRVYSYSKSTIIYDLDFIEKLTNLEVLRLYNLPSYNLNVPKWEEFLCKYRIYDPYKKKPLDLSPLGKLQNLKEINILNTIIKSFEPLSEIKNLECLSISDTRIRNKQHLYKMKNIKILHLLDVDFRDISPMIKLENLEELILSNTQISDYRPLKKIAKLKSLTLDDEQIVDFETINKLVNLRELRLSRVEINDLSVIKDLKNLRLLAL